MLILTRRLDESLYFRLPDGRPIVVTVTRVGSDNVRLGIEAPSDVQIVRSELVSELRVAREAQLTERRSAS